MACRGVLFALTDNQADRLLAASEQGDDQVKEIYEELDALWGTENLQETDKAWDSIHRCLSDGTTLLDGGTYPLNRTILGGRQLYLGDDYIVAFVTKYEVKVVATALKAVTKPWMRERFFQLIHTDYPKEYVDDEVFEYTWEYSEATRDFYRHAAKADRAVVFTVDQ